MALPSFAKRTVQVLRGVPASDHGTRVMDFSSAVPRDVPGCSFQPASGSDDTSHRSAAGGPAQLFMPPGTDVDALDLIKVSGKTYDIIGEPQVWDGPTPRTSHIALTLHIWEG